MKSLNRYSLVVCILIFLIALFSGCKKERLGLLKPGDNIQEALNSARQGEVIRLGGGTFEFDRTLTMDDKTDITIEGRGRNATILSFEGQVSGGDGLLITNSSNIVIRDLGFRDTPGDALKFKDSNSIVMYRVGAEWSGEPSAENGGYGLYPVNSSNILIDECYVYGASDSGIYVGQSDKAIVRNSLAEGNVAGIEIENTTNADVYNNTVRDNAAGILVFDLPGLSQSGNRTRVFNNDVINNMRGNFAPAGSIVAEVPAGTGILVLSTSEVEIFNNLIEQNNVVGTAVASYAALVALDLAPEIQDPDYNPYPAQIYIHENSFSRSDTYPPAEEQSFFGNLLVENFGENSIPDIILDGIFAPGTEPSGSICIEENEGSRFMNLNLADNFPDNVSLDQSPHDCSLEPLPEVELTIPRF